MEKIEFFSIAVNLSFLFFVLYLVRMKKLRLQYSLLWFLTFAIMALISFSPFLIDRIAPFVGIYYSPSLLFIMAFLFLLVIVLHYSVVISTLFESNKDLIQKFGIMANKLEGLEKKIN